MAQVRRRGPNKYLISLYLGRDKTGKRKYFNEYFHGTITEAKLRAAELTVKRARKGPSSLTRNIEEYLEKWLEQVKYSIAERTYETYQYHVKRLIPVVGHFQLYGLSSFDLQQGLNTLQGKPKTIKGVYGTLKTALRQAVAWGLLTTDPTVGLKTPRISREDRPILTSDELWRLLTAAEPYKYYLAIRLLALTGARLGEILGLQWQDIDFDNKTMVIRRTADTKYRKQKSDTKTFSSRRTLTLDIETIDLLSAHYKATQRKNRKIVPIKSDNLVFNYNGRVIREDAIRRTLRYALKKAGLPHMRVHDLRHTAGSLLLDAGCSFPAVAAFLGHSSPATTAAVYAHAVRRENSVATIIGLRRQDADQYADQRRKSR
ncbi:MAG: tyrosine-type recombinase/integrase [Bacillota bacterium]